MYSSPVFAPLTLPEPTSTPRKRPYRSSFTVVLNEAAYKYRGQCKYKSGKCPNERTLKFNGEIHTLCEEHRLRHNRIQNKSDNKIRKAKRLQAMQLATSHNRPHSVQPKLGNDLSDTTSCDDSDASSEVSWSVKFEDNHDPLSSWSPEDEYIFQNLIGLITSSS
ncbi:unnamed protein product [Aphanomyces euteiches]|uniref:Uncharacterized protein n=1 Tax=Aphanomyces euteiches TaxID=100861 RepID=A0A6G0X2P3_9STRA|nr:hypothetical protein Ae201684_009005 [Aphanomyces euteiches]KAH9073892.1 hypothetical protein Ae201684P_003391 [Aphanomyces euteiches]KAH9144606.1 hypothetical protein AeRB84_011464 [Aphanomyces euteiches]